MHLWVVKKGQEIAAGGLFGECCKIVQYHLSGSSVEHERFSPTRLMLADVFDWARERGNEQVHLGGGLGSSKDGLFHFKAGFSDLRGVFETLRIVSMRDEVEKYTGESGEMAVQLTENQTINVSLNEQISELDEVTAYAEGRKANITSVEMSVNKLPIKTIKRIPALMGEVDVIKALQVLPGVNSLGDGSSFFYVRGGSFDQNLMMIDEAPIYNPAHLFGFFSVISPDAINEMKVYKGDFPSRYGGRASSVIDITAREGNSRRFGFGGNIGLYATSLTVEGPFKKDKQSDHTLCGQDQKVRFERSSEGVPGRSRIQSERHCLTLPAPVAAQNAEPEPYGDQNRRFCQTGLPKQGNFGCPEHIHQDCRVPQGQYPKKTRHKKPQTEPQRISFQPAIIRGFHPVLCTQQSRIDFSSR